jgi:hypothetical protein
MQVPCYKIKIGQSNTIFKFIEYRQSSAELLDLIGETIFSKGEERLLALKTPTGQTMVLLLHKQHS